MSWMGLVLMLNPLQWRYNGRDSVSNHQPHYRLLNCLFRRRSKKISKFRVTGLCARNSPRTGEIPAQMASNAENVSIWWRHHALMNMTIFLLPIVIWHWHHSNFISISVKKHGFYENYFTITEHISVCTKIFSSIFIWVSIISDRAWH